MSTFVSRRVKPFVIEISRNKRYVPVKTSASFLHAYGLLLGLGRENPGLYRVRNTLTGQVKTKKIFD